MKKSKKGTWIIDDERYKFVVYIEHAAISKLIRYCNGFKSTTVAVEKYNALPNKHIEITWPTYHFKNITYSNEAGAMKYILEYYKGKVTKPKIAKKLIAYKEYLIAEYPELLI